MFIQPTKKVIKKDIDSIKIRPSFDINVEIMETRQGQPLVLERIQSLLELATTPKLQDLESNRIQSPISKLSNPNERIESVIKIFPDFKPCRENRNKYFNEFIHDNDTDIERLTDSIACIVPFYNEKANEIHATLQSLYFNFDYIKKRESKYKFTHFNVLLVGDGWFKADISTKRYLAKLYNCCKEKYEIFEPDEMHSKHTTAILQTKFNKKLCINPFNNDQKKLFLKVTTIIKIDNRKKANSHEWFLGSHGFAEWCKCDYMFFTDAYSTMNKEGLYQMMMHMKDPQNEDVVCCTGRARVYTIEQQLGFQNLLREKNVCDQENELEQKYGKIQHSYKWWETETFQRKDEHKNEDIMCDGEFENVFYRIQDMEYDHRLTINSHLRSCQMFEFEALYGTIGCYLLGGFLPVIPGPCGFYRSKYLLKDEVRGWYFEKINQKNDANNVDLVLGNMKLAEDRILTISSILNCDEAVRHSFVPECIFYFDPQPNLSLLMKQRRRWLNGSIATVIFVLRKISFSKWKVNVFRRYYVLSMWYMQLLMYLVLVVSPPLIFIVSFEYGLATILNVILVDHNNDGKKEKKIKGIVILCIVVSWIIYLLFIYFVQRDKKDIYKLKQKIVQLTLTISYSFGLLTLTGSIMQIVDIFRSSNIVNSNNNVTTSFNYAVIIIEGVFFIQSFILAPLISKDIKTLSILFKTCFHYFMYAAFYVTFFFIYSISNIHDLTWGTRPQYNDHESQNNNNNNNNPKHSTIKLLLIVIFMDIIIALIIQPFTQNIYSHLIFFSILILPSIFQIFFSLLWFIKTRLIKIWTLCKPKKIGDHIEYVGLTAHDNLQDNLHYNL